MDLESSLEALFSNLTAWATLPKYAVERRLDVFLALYLPRYLSATLVVPEFPLKRADSNRSVNLDYLMFRRGPKPAWLFVELKTDPRSVRDEQLRMYLAAREKGMAALVREIREDVRAATRGRANKEKYDAVVNAVTADGRGALLNAPIEIVYLSPSDPHGEGVRWISLGEFAAHTPAEHGDLWTLVRPVLDTMQARATSRARKPRAEMEPGPRVRRSA